MPLVSETAEWKALAAHKSEIENVTMRSMFDSEGGEERFEKFSTKVVGDCQFEMLLDYSKNKMNSDTMEKLYALAKKQGVEDTRDKMFKGEKVNSVEGKPVAHMGLRSPSPKKDIVDLKAKMKQFVVSLRKGEWVGSTGKPITDVINIGIGGSHLGPDMVNQALKNYQGSIKMHCVSNVDGCHLAKVLKETSGAENCLFIVTSYHFDTSETLLNAKTAKKWCKTHMKDQFDVSKHFVAVTTNTNAAVEFGISSDNCFGYSENVPGRFSVWGSVGLSVAINIGWSNWEEFLSGANNMDHHFTSSSMDQNMPIILALLGVWYRNFFEHSTHAILSYDNTLSKFVSYFQMSDMESSGKSVTQSGEPVEYSTGHILWGETGTNCQHIFNQLLHQGTEVVPVDLIAFAKPVSEELFINKRHHNVLLANVLAQGEIMMRGRTAEDVKAQEPGVADNLVAHKTYHGNKPSNTIVIKKLTPYALGNLMALYEHKIFVQGCLWGINSFDRFGVEHGKVCADQMEPLLAEDVTETDKDASTDGLLQFIREMQVFNPFA